MALWPRGKGVIGLPVPRYWMSPRSRPRREAGQGPLPANGPLPALCPVESTQGRRPGRSHDVEVTIGGIAEVDIGGIAGAELSDATEALRQIAVELRTIREGMEAQRRNEGISSCGQFVYTVYRHFARRHVH